MKYRDTKGGYQGPSVLVLGWDAGCFTYLKSLLTKGQLPSLQNLMTRGAFGNLISTVPPMTPVAWTSILTGCNPGKHGIYNWWYPKGDNYDLCPYDSTSIQVPNLFRLLSNAGFRVGAVNIPLTSPAPKVNGFCLGGFSHPGRVNELAPDSVYPPDLKDTLSTHHSKFFGIDPKAFDHATSNEELLAAWEDTEELRLDLVEDLVRQYEPELLWVHCHVGDYFGHRLPLGSPILEQAFILIDSTLGKLLDLCPPEATVLVVSDHGQTEIHKFIMVHNWLEQQGLLRFRSEIPQDRFGNTALRLLNQLGVQVTASELEQTILGVAELYYQLPASIQGQITDIATRYVPGCLKSHHNIDWSRTRAFSCAFYGHIRLNLKGREAQGIVDLVEYDALVDEICQGLEKLHDPETSAPIGIRALRREEVYSGPRVIDAPDIVCELSDPSYYFCPIYSLHLHKASVVCPIDHEELARTFRFLDLNFHGDHTAEGFFVVAGPKVGTSGRQNPMQAVDVAPTLLHLFGLKSPTYMDGIAHEHLWNRDLPTPHASTPQDLTTQARVEQDEQEIINDLRRLGYRL